MTTTRRGILERLAAGPVLGDGGYLLELEKRGYVQAGPFTPEVSLTQSDRRCEGLHREFLRAGAEVLQALTFYAAETSSRPWACSDEVDDINSAAVSHRPLGGRRGRRARGRQPQPHLDLRRPRRRRRPRACGRPFDASARGAGRARASTS